MKITTKINLITAAWVICVLLAVNAIVYFSFMKISVNMEGNALQQKPMILYRNLIFMIPLK